MNARTSPRKASSRSLNLRSIIASASYDLEQASRALAAADAHGDDGVFDAAPFALDQRVPGHACARHAVGVTDGDRSAIDVEAIHWDAEPVAAVDDLAGEGLVQLPQADVLEVHARSLEETRHGEHGADAHLVGLTTGHRQSAIDAHRREAAARRLLVGHEHACAGAVGELTGVACRDELVIAA